MTASHHGLARKRIALLLVLSSALGCTREVVIGAVEGAGGAGGSTAATPFADCRTAVPTCGTLGNTCDCTQSCPPHMLEARCAEASDWSSQCDCLVDDVQVSSCSQAAPPTPLDQISECDLVAGCCAAFFPAGG